MIDLQMNSPVVRSLLADFKIKLEKIWANKFLIYIVLGTMGVLGVDIFLKQCYSEQFEWEIYLFKRQHCSSTVTGLSQDLFYSVSQ